LCNNSQVATNCSTNKDILIIGPTFSGSLASLRRLTNAVPSIAGNKPHFNAFSGTVSSICAIKNQGLLEQDSSATSVPECAQNVPAETLQKPISSSHLTFHTLVVDSESAVQEFISVLHSKDAIQCGENAPAQVAILSEAATTYGSALAKKVSQKDCAYTDLRYPREISSLRNASSSSEPAAAGSQLAGTSDGPGYLPFTLADQQSNSGDEPPDFSRAQGLLSKEAVLMKYAADLRRGHYKYVGISGTNVLDVLFLANFFAPPALTYGFLFFTPICSLSGTLITRLTSACSQSAHILLLGAT
jgi:hypothetical protein